MGNQAACRSSQSSSLISPLVSAALIQGTREEASYGGFQYLHCTHPVSLPASAHTGNIANFVHNDFLFYLTVGQLIYGHYFRNESYLEAHLKTNLLPLLIKSCFNQALSFCYYCCMHSGARKALQ